MGVVVRAGELLHESDASYSHKDLFVDGTFADPRTTMHLRVGSTGVDGSAAPLNAEARKLAHYACLECVPFFGA